MQGEDAAGAVHALSQTGFAVTRLQSQGGFLQQGNATLLIGVDDERVEAAIKVLRDSCRERNRYLTPMPPLVEPGEFLMSQPVEVQVGGATIFVLNVEQFEQV